MPYTADSNDALILKAIRSDSRWTDDRSDAEVLVLLVVGLFASIVLIDLVRRRWRCVGRTGTLLAWHAVKFNAREQNSGWSRMFEYLVGSPGRAYTIAAMMALRKGFHDTRAWFSHETTVRDGAPFVIGEGGHWFIGDRIGATAPGDDTYTIRVDRVRELTVA